jgi:hypothetical protein
MKMSKKKKPVKPQKKSLKEQVAEQPVDNTPNFHYFVAFHYAYPFHPTENGFHTVSIILKKPIEFYSDTQSIANFIAQQNAKVFPGSSAPQTPKVTIINFQPMKG